MFFAIHLLQVVRCASIRVRRGAGDDDVLRNIEADIVQPGQKVETSKPDATEVKKGVSSVNASEGGGGAPASESGTGGLGSSLSGFFNSFLNQAKDQAQKSVTDDLAKEVGNLAQKYGAEIFEKVKGAISSN